MDALWLINVYIVYVVIDVITDWGSAGDFAKTVRITTWSVGNCKKCCDYGKTVKYVC
jgi:hypothetical protein